MVRGGARDVAPVVGVDNSHVRGGVGVPADGVEESGVVGVEDGVGATFVIDIEGPEGFSRSEHCGLNISGIKAMCGQLNCRNS